MTSWFPSVLAACSLAILGCGAPEGGTEAPDVGAPPAEEIEVEEIEVPTDVPEEIPAEGEPEEEETE